ncbi:hypothetical protein Dthio_PD2106 [Desulfonatronospira thiodismutans ASO3-1]|uniref:Uncharacterized protein n=1 Tax=Desulfonatronospira thiodismutans ASO3-1 TaxID=555779 RepID=D6SPQ7_9BACT|nr:hypothetical protein [Desulfonatronospira thiodismutans]EFI34733.1 hypothetical protein Dthio_PD2106 [Desulfonatronospira thiodismutans ASO3-1]
MMALLTTKDCLNDVAAKVTFCSHIYYEEMWEKCIKNQYLFSAFKESRGQALRDPLEHHFVLKKTQFLGQVGPGRASPRATCKALNKYKNQDVAMYLQHGETVILLFFADKMLI